MRLRFPDLLDVFARCLFIGACIGIIREVLR